MNVIFKLMFVTIVITAATSCNDNEEPVKTTTKTTQPKFVKEGELGFLQADGRPIVKINIEIAETDAEQQQGLMNRPFMSNDQGMLFIFNRDEPRSFWMRNTIIPLDIIYVNSSMEIIHIAENTEPYSDRPVPSGKPARYVVEVNAGFCAQYGITDGCKIQYSRI